MQKPIYYTAEQLNKVIEQTPRFKFLSGTTPLEELRNLSRFIDGPPIFVKRDDLTGPAFGGNKVRHFEFVMGYVLEHGHDVVIAEYPPSSNAARIMAAACTKTGIRFILLVKPGEHLDPLQGNPLIYHLMNAEMVFLETSDSKEIMTKIKSLEDQLKQSGHNPFIFQHTPWHHHAGTLGYLQASIEIGYQLDEKGINDVHFYIVSGHSHAGLQLGAKLMGKPWHVTGITVSDYVDYKDALPIWTKGVTELLHIPVNITPEEVQIDQSYEGFYPIPTEASIEAIHIAAKTENLILDPVYTGKAMAGLIDHIKKGLISKEIPVVFIHTGGTPLIFQYENELQVNLVRHNKIDTISTD